ncbi:hypothetical protein KBC79_05380 [Candidatus Woesebacteria bacterium]|nr:hypothetical protein [Candidatus Woesebacteria bacterium]
MPPAGQPIIPQPGDGVTIDLQNQAVGRLPGITPAVANDPSGGFGKFIGTMLQVSMTIAALMLFLYLIWGGIEWISSGGDKSKIEKARNRITGSITGMIVLSAVVALFLLIQGFLGISILTFTFGGGSGPVLPPGGPGGL